MAGDQLQHQGGSGALVGKGCMMAREKLQRQMAAGGLVVGQWRGMAT